MHSLPVLNLHWLDFVREGKLSVIEELGDFAGDARVVLDVFVSVINFDDQVHTAVEWLATLTHTQHHPHRPHTLHGTKGDFDDFAELIFSHVLATGVHFHHAE